MDLTVLSDDLARELGPCRKLTDGKLPFPILASVYLSAETGRIHLTATNTIVGLRTSCAAQVDINGVVCVPAKTLDEIANRLPGTQLRLVVKGDTLAVSGGGFKATLQLQPADDYPRVAVPEGESWNLPVAGVIQGLKLVRFAAISNDAKLLGVLLELCPAASGLPAGGEMRLVATDAHRLAVFRTPCSYTIEKSSVFVPRQAVDLLVPLLEGQEGHVDFVKTYNNLFFTIGDRQVISRPLEAVFPAWERILQMNAKSDKHVEVNRLVLMGAVNRSQIALESNNGAVKLSFRKDEVAVDGKSAKVGQAAEVVAAVYAGEDVFVALNSDYVIDVLNAVESEVVAFDLHATESPVFMSPVKGADYQCVIMPVNPAMVK